MNAYPIGNDLTVKWSLLYSDGSVFPLSNYDYELSYRTNRGNKVVTDTSVISVDENILTWTFKGDEQVVSGRYTLCLKITLSGSKVIELQYDNAFMLSPISGFKGAGSEIVLQSYCDAIDLKDAVLQARKAMDLAADAVIDTAKSAEDAKAAKEAAEDTAAQAKDDATSAMAMAMEASGKVAIAEQAATDASIDAAAAQQAAQTASDHIVSLEQAIADLPDGQAVTAKVAEHTIKLTELERKTEDMGAGIGYISDDILLNISNFADANGHFYDNNGVDQGITTPYRLASKKYRVTEGQRIDYAIKLTKSALMVAMFDKDGNLLLNKSLVGTGAYANSFFLVPSGVSYVSFCSYNASSYTDAQPLSVKINKYEGLKNWRTDVDNKIINLDAEVGTAFASCNVSTSQGEGQKMAFGTGITPLSIDGDFLFKIDEISGFWRATLVFTDGTKAYINPISETTLIEGKNYSGRIISGIQVFKPSDKPEESHLKASLHKGFIGELYSINERLNEDTKLIGKVYANFEGTKQGAHQEAIIGTLSNGISVPNSFGIIVNELEGGSFNARFTLEDGTRKYITLHKGLNIVDENTYPEDVVSLVIYKEYDGISGYINLIVVDGTFISNYMTRYHSNNPSVIYGLPCVRQNAFPKSATSGGYSIKNATYLRLPSHIITNSGRIIVAINDFEYNDVTHNAISFSDDGGASWAFEVMNTNCILQGSMTYDKINNVIWSWGGKWYKSIDNGNSFIDANNAFRPSSPLAATLAYYKNAEKVAYEGGAAKRYAYATNIKICPTTGIQLSNGVLAVPFYESMIRYDAQKNDDGSYPLGADGYPIPSGNGLSVEKDVCFIVYSKDFGATWIQSPCTPLDKKADESAIVEVSDNKILINSRVQTETYYGVSYNTFRNVFVQSGNVSSERSTYEIDGFEYVSEYDNSSLKDFICQGSLTKFVYRGNVMWLFSSINVPYMRSQYPRKNLTLYVSCDAYHWSKVKLVSPEDEEIWGYSSLYANGDKLSIVYEGRKNMGVFYVDLMETSLDDILKTYLMNKAIYM